MSKFDERFFLTFDVSHARIKDKWGGDCIYALILFIFSIFLSYNLISYRDVLKKSKYVNSNNLNFKQFSNILVRLINKNKYIKVYLNSVNEKLKSLENPYGITIGKYVIIKYFLSSFIFIIVLFRDNNVILSSILFLSMFLLNGLTFKIMFLAVEKGAFTAFLIPLDLDKFLTSFTD